MYIYPRHAKFGTARRFAVTVALGIVANSTYATQVDIPGPSGSVNFGSHVKALPNGNFVVVDSGFNAITHVGAVYLYGPTGVLISKLTGSTTLDLVGAGGVTVLGNGNFLVHSPYWNNGASTKAGAVTWVNGNTGLSGTVSAANSLVGTHTDDQVGYSEIVVLGNGNYVVMSPVWDSGAATDAGAITWGNGATGRVGAISAANSLIGLSTDDHVGGDQVTVLGNGHFVAVSRDWDNGAVPNAGAVTWVNGGSGRVGAISALNSLVGTQADDSVGYGGVTALSNGHYVVASAYWSNGAIADVGAVTWCNGASGRVGVVSAANSLVGVKADDNVGYDEVTALSNGNYVVASSHWDNGASVDAGAATWAPGGTGLVGVVSIANSLFGTKANDRVGYDGITALSNGNYVVSSPFWSLGAATSVGAVTVASGTTGLTSAVSIANSLHGTTTNDFVGNDGVFALSNGNYVVASPAWDRGAVANAGAVTWGNGSSGLAGAISTSNSLVGSSTDDQVGVDQSSNGSGPGVTVLNNGNYVVRSVYWHNGGAANAGAVTWGNGNGGLAGSVSASNSLIGAVSDDQIGSRGVTALSTGHYVVNSPKWNLGASLQAGAVTWGNGSSGRVGTPSLFNSLVGVTTGDQVGGYGVTALSDGNYVINSPHWSNGGVLRIGAVTWANGSSGLLGTIAGNSRSLVGALANDNVGDGSVTALVGGLYVVASGSWDLAATANTGAVSLVRHDPASGAALIGINGSNSVRGSALGSGGSLRFDYDAPRGRLIVGRQADNIVSLFTLPPALPFANGFE
jgi:Repeat of unknown function (DUF5650)